MIGFEDILGQDGAVKFLRTVCRADRLPHAMLFAGPSGVGKGTCALALAGWFLCHKPGGDKACGKCESCRGLGAGTHPDYHVVTKELVRYHDKTGKSKATLLSVEVIRHELVERANHTAVLGKGKFFVVEQAELMNTAAQNALLKTLEEPLGRTAIVLLTDAPESLLATVRSRCQVVRFGTLDTKLVQKRLTAQGVDAAIAAEAAELSEGSIGAAQRFIAEEVLAAARQLHEQIDQLFAGRAPADLPGWFKKAADARAERELARDPLASKDAAARAGLALYLGLTARHIGRRLRSETDAGELEKACGAIDAVARCVMYLDANVNVSVALGQLAGSLV